MAKAVVFPADSFFVMRSNEKVTVTSSRFFVNVPAESDWQALEWTKEEPILDESTLLRVQARRSFTQAAL